MTCDSRARQLIDQLAERGITDQRVLDALERIPRPEFVPAELRDRAWEDTALPISHGQTISQPYIVGWMSALLRLSGTETVLEVGTGSGYQTAILALLAGHVVTIERIPALSDIARERLKGLGIQNVSYVVGDGTLGSPEDSPFDGILVTAGAPDVPAPLYRQLRAGGRMVIPVGTESEQQMQLIIKTPTGPQIRILGGCRFVPLIGDAGWEPPGAA